MHMFLAAILAASQPLPNSVASSRGAWIFATVGQSEWCPAGNVKLNLSTGRYTFTKRGGRPACQNPLYRRTVVNGRLAAKRLAIIRKAFLRSLNEGLETSLCRAGGHPDFDVISNGGTRILALTTEALQASAPNDLACWTETAKTLHALLSDTFRSEAS